MASEKDLSELFKGFSKLSRGERYEKLKAIGALNDEEIQFLDQGGMQSLALGEKFIENVIGYFQLPMGVATNFNINGQDYVIPLAVEETSIVAAASKTARWVREKGEINTRSVGTDIIGQIQIAKVKNMAYLESVLTQRKAEWIAWANTEVASGLVKRGGGVNDITLRKIQRPDGLQMAVIHVYCNPCEAMGANIMNQICEGLKGPIMDATGEMVSMCILSNLVDSKLTQVEVVLHEVDEDLAERIEEASLFAELDPYRAATNNKGVLNGIDPVLIATGNDWRAVEAGVHAYAAKDGQYRSITKWRRKGQQLVGTLTAPIVVGTVGGVTKLHPTAQLALKMMGSPNSEELSQIAAAVGLVQNLGALRALTTVGIIEGHMKLHIKNLTLSAGADDEELPLVQKELEKILVLQKRISLSHAVEVLAELRGAREKSKREARAHI